jgi:hypothetical protein
MIEHLVLVHFIVLSNEHIRTLRESATPSCAFSVNILWNSKRQKHKKDCQNSSCGGKAQTTAMPPFIAEPFGSTTSVPSHPLCRLSFYLKCCSVGCGLDVAVDKQLTDYPNAHVLPIHLQSSIIRLALDVFDPRTLVGHSIFVDDNYRLMPRQRENAFFKLKQLPGDFQRDQSNLLQYPHQRPSREVMLCTTKWLHVFYTAPLLATINVMETPILPVARATPCSEYPMHTVCYPALSAKRASVSCNACSLPLHDADQYNCMTCCVGDSMTLCETCYYEGEHDQTHFFERIRRGQSAPEPSLLCQVEAISPCSEQQVSNSTYCCPVAVAIPIEQAHAMHGPAASLL